MKTDFWLNMESARIEARKERKAITFECGLTSNAFSRGIERKSDPGVSTAYRLARSVNKTIEELVDGDSGLEYVRSVLKEDGALFAPPERIADIVEGIMGLSDDELAPIRGALKAMLDRKDGSGALPESKSGAKTRKTG
jgi:hypothetical protein